VTRTRVRPPVALTRSLAALALAWAVSLPVLAAEVSSFRVVTADVDDAVVVQLPGRAPFLAEAVPGLPGFVLVEAGPMVVTLLLPATDAPDDPAAASTVLARLEIDLEGATYATLVVSSTTSSGAPPSRAPPLATYLLVEELDALPPGANASLQIALAGGEGGTVVDIDVRRVASDDRSPEATLAVTLAAGRAAPRAVLPAGPYELLVTTDGTTPSISPPLALDLRPGTAYTVVVSLPHDASGAVAAVARAVIDAVRPEPPQLATAPADATPHGAETAALHVVHLSPDAPPVDVLVDGRGAVRDLAFLSRSHTLFVPAGRHEVRVYPHRPPRRTVGEGARRAVALEPVVTVLNLAAGTSATVVLTGSYEPPPDEGGGGHLSLQVDPADATVTLAGPRGYRAVLRGDQFLVGLEPGPYRAEVARAGYVGATYELELLPQTTSLVSITLQEEQPDTPTTEVEERLERLDRPATWRGLELQPYADTGAPLPPPGHALVRVVHTAPTVTPLDVAVALLAAGGADDAEPLLERRFLAQGLGFPNPTPYTSVPAGDHALELWVAGTRTLLHELTRLPFLAGVTYIFFVSADPRTNEVWLVPVVEAVIPHLRGEAPR
jgi:hypothetical protein